MLMGYICSLCYSLMHIVGDCRRLLFDNTKLFINSKKFVCVGGGGGGAGEGGLGGKAVVCCCLCKYMN